MLLAHGEISCGERLGLIIVDNAVEYMLIAYVESHRRLVGSGKGKVIKTEKWNETKRRFEPLLDFVISQDPGIAAYRGDIMYFHDTRNLLYHAGKPHLVKPQQVDEYLKVARRVFESLFGVKVTDAIVEATVANIHSSLIREAKSQVTTQVSFKQANGLVRLKTVFPLGNADAICLVLHGFAIEVGRAPNFQELLGSLHLSGFTLKDSILSVRLSELRSKGLVQRGQLALTARGRKDISKRYLPS